MKVVIDTNVLVAAIGKTSPYRKIFDDLLSKKFVLILSNDIVMEYWEIIARKSTDTIADNIIKSLLSASNVELCTVFFNWNMIAADKEDNKFCDATIAANADYLVTNDNHFNILKDIDFPKISILSAKNFVEVLKTF